MISQRIFFLFKQCAAGLAEMLDHLMCFFDAQPEIVAETLDAHTFLRAAVYHLSVKADIVIRQRL